MYSKIQISSMLRRWVCAVFLFPFVLPGSLVAQGFSGEWRTSLGKLSIVIDNRQAGGHYRGGGEEGQLNGRLLWQGRLLAGTWQLDDQQGRVFLRLTDSQNAFVGHWLQPDGQPGGEWIGVRETAAQEQNAAARADFSGEWASNYGRMILNSEPGKVLGEFTGKHNKGRITGQENPRSRKLVSNWQDQDNRGTAIFKLLPGGDGFLGEWWYDDYTYGGYWFGVRPLVLSGPLAGDSQNGFGVYVWIDGSIYIGNWKNGVYHGQGSRYTPTGKLESRGVWVQGVYQGKCLSGDCLNGKGQIRFSNGDQYHGEFREGRLEGQGHYRYANGDTYEGGFKNNRRHGRGVYVWSNGGDRYEGEFSLGKIQGEGKYIFSNGDIYQGRFRRGMRSGKGVMILSNGEQIAGQWRDDQFKSSRVLSNAPESEVATELAEAPPLGTKNDTGDNRLRDILPRPLISQSDSNSPAAAEKAHRIRKPAGSDQRQDYLFWKTREQQPSAADSSALPELIISYLVVSAPGQFPGSRIREMAGAQLGANSVSGMEMEPAADYRRTMYQIVQRFRLANPDRKTSTSFLGYHRLGE